MGVVAALLVLAAVSLRRRGRSLRIWAAAGIGIITATFSVGSLGVFVHGYVISTLPAAAARVAVLLAVVAGMATALLWVSVGIERIPVQPPAAVQAPARNNTRAGGADRTSETRPCPHLLEAPDEDIPSTDPVRGRRFGRGPDACGGSGSSQPAAPTIQPARTFELTGFEPAGQVNPGKPATLAFRSGSRTAGRSPASARGAGPHTGVHVIIVRNDLSTIDPPPPADRRRTGRSGNGSCSRLPAPTEMVVDVYPQLSGPLRNFQLFRTIRVAARAPAAAASLPLHGGSRRLPRDDARHPALEAIQAGIPDVTVTDPNGQAGEVHALVRGARARDLLPCRARSTTSTRTSARPTRAAPAYMGGPRPGTCRSRGSSTSAFSSGPRDRGGSSCSPGQRAGLHRAFTLPR